MKVASFNLSQHHVISSNKADGRIYRIYFLATGNQYLIDTQGRSSYTSQSKKSFYKRSDSKPEVV
jgi:hypothetical protein